MMKPLFGNQKRFVLTLATLLIVFSTQVPSYGQALNVGEPRTVRLFYFLPNDRPYRQEVVDAMKTGILEVQSFFAEQMEAHGHGRKTFQIETDDQGDPVVHRVDGDYNDSHYSRRGVTEGEISRAFDISSIVHLIVMDISRTSTQGFGGGNKNQGVAVIYGSWNWFAAAHELGHAFGLQHDFRQNSYIMSYGKYNRSYASLSEGAADFLSVHPYFNSSIPFETVEIGLRPTFELLSSTRYPLGATSVPVRLRVRADRGLHQVIILVSTKRLLGGSGGREVKAFHKLAGETDKIFEFNYDGITPSDKQFAASPAAYTSLSDPLRHPISFLIVDTEGNNNGTIGYSQTILEAVEPEIVPVAERTPQVRDAIVAAVPSVNSANDVTAAHLAAITSLDLSSQDMPALKSGDFDGLTALTNLNLSGNDLTSLPEDVFDGLSSLTTLTLRSNRLTALPPDIFDGLTALTTLDLSNLNELVFGEFTTLPVDVFDGLTALTTLNLQGNDFSTLPAGVFDGLTALTELWLNANKLTTLPAGVFDGLTQLEELKLFSNKLRTLPGKIFEDLTSAKTIRLSNNELSSLPVDTFDGLTSLEALFLSDNQLTSLPADLFDGLTSLQAIFLVNNQLTTLPSDIFDGLTSLSNIRLHDNKLRSLPDSIFEGLNGLRSLSLGGNTVDPLRIPVLLEKVADGQFKAVVPTGAPFDIVLPISVRLGSIIGGATSIRIPTGSVESNTLTVTHTPGEIFAATVDIGKLPGLPTSNGGYSLMKSGDLPLKVTEGDIADAVTFTMTVGTIDVYGRFGFSRPRNPFTPIGSLSPQTFNLNGITYTVTALYYSQYHSTKKYLYFETSPLLPRGFELYLDSQQFNSAACRYVPWLDDKGYNVWDNVDVNWSSGQIVRVRLVETTPIPPGPPINLQATIHFEDVTLTWELPVNADPTSLPIDEYELRISDDGGTTWDRDWNNITDSGSGEENRSSITIGSGIPYHRFSNGIEYTFEVRAKGGDGPGDAARVTLIVNKITSIYARTPQVRDAIVAAAGVNSPKDVTEAHLRAITSLSLLRDSITRLRVGDFDGLTALTILDLFDNQLATLPEGIFDGLTALKELWLQSNSLTQLPIGVFDGLSALEELSLNSNSLSSLPEDVFDGLSNLTSLGLSNNKLTSLPEDVFDGLSNLTSLGLSNNKLTSLPEDVFDGLTALKELWLQSNSLTKLPIGVFDGLSNLTSLRLSDNSLTSLPAGVFEGLSNLTTLAMYNNPRIFSLTVSLEKVGKGQFKATAPTGAPFDIVLPLTITNGSISGGAITITIPAGNVESETLTVTRTPGTSNAILADIETLPARPKDHFGYSLIKHARLPLVFTELGGAELTPVSERTPQVRDAIVDAVPGITSANDVTVAHLSAVTHLNNLKNQSITSLKVGDFDGLTSLTDLDLRENDLKTLPASIFKDLTALTSLGLQGNDLKTLPLGTFDGLTALTFLGLSNNTLTTLPAGIFKDLTALKRLWLTENALTTLPVGIFDSLTALDWLSLHHNDLTKLPADIFKDLTSLTQLDLNDNTLTTLPVGIFDGLTAVMSIDLLNNELPSLPDGLFRGLTALKSFRLGSGAVNPLPLIISLEKVADGRFKAVAPAGAPFNIVLPLTAANGSITGGATSVTIPVGSVESEVLTVTRTPGTTAAVTVDIGTLPGLPSNHYGYALRKSTTHLPLAVIAAPQNSAPVFTDGTSTTRTVAENTAANTNIGTAIAATDADNDTLTYTLSGTDAAAFTIVSTTGQLRTQAALDYEAKSTYSIRVSVSDGNGGSDSITVTINITDVKENRAPVFSKGTSTTRSIAENTAAGQNIGAAISATDADSDTLTYTLGGTDAAAFSIVSTTGQLRTRAALDYETKSSYSVTVTVSDGNGGTDSITITINVTDVNELPDTPGEDPPEPTTDTRIAFEAKTPAEYTRVTLNDNGTVWGIPTKYTTDSHIGTVAYMALAALMGCDFADAEVARQSKVYIKRQSLGTLSNFASGTVCGKTSRTWSGSWDAVRITHLRFFDETSTPNIKEAVYNADTDQIEIPGVWQPPPNKTTNTAPVFADGTSTTRTVPENTAANTNIGTPIVATDADNDTLTYKLPKLAGTDASFFSINSTTGQLKTKAALDYETKNTYTVKVTVSDGSLTDTITVTINVTDVNELPTSTNVCKVGDVLKPGQSCTYPGTDAVFSVLNDGTAQWHIPNLPAWLEWINQTSVSGSLRVSTTVNGQAYHFVAEQVGTSWEIKEIGDDRSDPQPETPVTPEPPEGTGITPTLSTSAAAPLTEATLHGGIITLDLSGGVFESSHFRIRNAVSVSGIDGVTVESFGGDRISDTQATVELEYDGNMTANGTLTVSVGAGAIKDYDGAALTAQITVTSVTESVTASTAAPLTEATLDESVVTLTLSGRKFERSNFDIRDAVSVSGIAGVTVGTFDIDRVNDTEVTVELTFEGDMTTDGTLTFTVGADAVAGYNGPALTAQVSVSAGVAPADTDNQNPDPPETPQQPQDKDPPEVPINTGGTPTLTVSTAAPLTEATLHGGVVTLTLSGGTYERSGFTIKNALTVSGINGVTVETFGVDRVNDTTVTVELEFNGNINSDSSLTFTVGAGAIVGYTGSALTAQIRVTANTESVVASTAAPLTETTLHESVVTLTLSGAKYASSIWDIRDGVSVSGIAGVTKPWNQPERKNDTELTVELEFDGTDFDSTATLTFTVGADAIAGYNGPALTTQITVTAGTESVVASTAAPLKEASLDGSVVTLTLNGTKYAGSIWDIRGGVTVSGIAGVTIPWNQPDRKSDTQITVELEFDGNMTTDGTLTFTVGADAIAGYNGPALKAQITVTADRENALLANFPNPFNPETWIPYQLAKPTEVTITIYASNGQVVRQLALGHQPAGFYYSRSRAAYWDGRNQFGEPVASGVYFYTLTAGDFTATRKMLIRK